MSNWYGVSLVFEATHELTSVPTTLWEERVVLVQADEEDTARILAEAIGRDSEHEYEVASPEPHMLRWRFRGVESIYELLSETLGHGVEVFSRLLGAEEGETLLKRIDPS
jgi:hypothetical protein